jgi:hypothetical protein
MTCVCESGEVYDYGSKPRLQHAITDIFISIIYTFSPSHTNVILEQHTLPDLSKLVGLHITTNIFSSEEVVYGAPPPPNNHRVQLRRSGVQWFAFSAQLWA